jgi:predicted RND superfamily exporter protein
MWEKSARFILRQRLYILIVIGLLTAVMGYYAQFAEIRYDFAKLLPVTDSTYIEYENFKTLFGEDGNVLFVGVTDENLYELDHFNAWYDLGEKLKTLNGVEEVVSVAKLYNLSRNDSLKKFDFLPIITEKPKTQQELDSLKNTILSLPFYREIIYNPETKATIMFITMSKKVLDNKKRIEVVSKIEETVKEYETKQNVETHISGLPYIRSIMSVKVSNELRMFLFLAFIITAVILFLFFRSFRIVFFCMVVVAVGVVWCMGLQGMLAYKISVLTGLIPPLLIVIGIPNCIFLLNRYHSEYKKHGNQAKALVRVVSKIGNAALLTNATTAAGFATFILVDSQIMREFGIVASISILFMFILSLTLIPIVFSYIAPPAAKHIKHLESKLLTGVIERIVTIVDNHRWYVYLTTVAVLILSAIGISKMRATGNIVDDLPQDDEAYIGLKYFEKNFHGVMPFEIEIDTKKKGKVMSPVVFKKIDELEEVLASYPEFSKSLSVVEVLKFSRQAFYRGDSTKYGLPSQQEQAFILDYIPEKTKKKNQLQSFIDSNKQITRVSVHIEDIGTYELRKLRANLEPRIDSIFPPDKYNVTLTGTSVVFLKGNEYMVNNLFQSIALAILLISAMMAWLFASWRMVLISLIPNIIPQLVTAALMGYMGIPIKISTILVFSIAFGISVDNTIHFLAKYRQELKLYEWNIRKSALLTLREIGIGMIYTSIVLYFGFGIFMLSTFGGTKALGLLLSTTLMVAMFCNLFILPTLILSLEKSLTTKAFNEPLLEIYDEEEDIDLESLKIKKTEQEE